MYERDGNGRLVSRDEVEWDDSERAWMLALAEYDTDVCPGCGGLLSETTHQDADGAYTTDPPVRCHRCTVLAIARKDIRDHHAQPEALFPIIRRRGE